MRVLAIETSCDDTSVALVAGQGRVEVVLSAHQDLLHKPFGGIVPEIASRNHTLQVLPLIEEAFQRTSKSWDDVEGLVVTNRPGLLGSLLVGVVTAKTLALAKNLPFIGVNHIEGHLLAPLLVDDSYAAPVGFGFPYLGLAVSGGHTHLFVVEGVGKYQLIGETIDDAAGEAFDKFAKMVGLGFPGGALVDQSAAKGNPKAFAFPRPVVKGAELNFSFSGLKTAALRSLEGLSQEQILEKRPDLCASFQEAVVDVLVDRLALAARETGLQNVAITGGVAANSRLRSRASEWAKGSKKILAIPPLRFCTDNAAMIGLAGQLRMEKGESSSHEMGPLAQSLPTDFRRSP